MESITYFCYLKNMFLQQNIGNKSNLMINEKLIKEGSYII